MSRLPFELLLALRYLRPKRTFVSIITLISVLGVTLGVAVLIIVISVMSGFDAELKSRVLGVNSHIKIFGYDPDIGRNVLISDYGYVMRSVASNQNVVAVSPFMLVQVMVETEPTNGPGTIGAPWLRGVEMSTETNVSQLINNIILGTNDISDNGLLVGVDFAREMDLHPGDHMAVYTTRDLARMKQSLGQTNQVAPVPPDYEVRGIFDSGFFEYNATVVVGSLEDVQNLYDLGDEVQGIMVKIKDPYQAGKVSAELQHTLGPKFRISTWDEDNATMLAVLVEKNVMFYILFFIVIVAAFGITCTLITFVVQKTREIGVMKALGAGRRQIMWIFLSQSMAISVMGIILGTVLGMVAVSYRNEFLGFMRRTTGFELFPASVYNLYQLPALVVPGDILIICGGSFLICVLAAAFPVWHASRLKPVDALRYE